MDYNPQINNLYITPKTVSRLVDCGPDPKWQDWIQSAIEEGSTLGRPRARTMELPREQLEPFFNHNTPVRKIAEQGKKIWTFVATIGPELETQVKAYSEQAKFLESVLLDAVGSSMAEALCDYIERETRSRAKLPKESGSSKRFSPGYCHWSLEAQPHLFKHLSPKDLGIRLLPSLLMNPLKSVSGIIVMGAQDRLRAPRQACRECKAKGCVRRLN